MTIPGPPPGFDPQPPPADEHLPSTDAEVDAGLAQPFGGPAHEEVHVFEQVEGVPLTQPEADALVGQSLDVVTEPSGWVGEPGDGPDDAPLTYVEGSDPGEEAIYRYEDHMGADEALTIEPGDPWPENPRPAFVAPSRLKAEELLAGRNGPALLGHSHPSTPSEAVALATAYALLAQVEVAEYHASFLQG